MKVKVPRKLKKERNKIEIHCYPHVKDKNGFLKEEIVILPNIKMNKWTLKFASKLKKELKERNNYMWKEVCEEFLNPNKINRKYFKNNII